MLHRYDLATAQRERLQRPDWLDLVRSGGQGGTRSKKRRGVKRNGGRRAIRVARLSTQRSVAAREERVISERTLSVTADAHDLTSCIRKTRRRSTGQPGGRAGT